jgi:LacI family transcriptional regulator
MQQLFQTLRLPAALFAANDEYALKAITLAEELGMKVPEQVAVLGVDNDDLLVEAGPVSLSSIDLPTFKIGFEAARLLDQILKGESPQATMIKLPPLGPVTRKSTDITAIPDANITAALAFIRQHAADPISVNDVVKAVTISRRVLERRFQKYLQRSVYDEVQRVHIERACRMLIDTELQVVEVGDASGFSGRARFHATFAKAMGHTPKQYRNLYQNRETMS